MNKLKKHLNSLNIKFGHGAIHYKDFPLSQCTKKDGNYKKWLICPIDGLRYYY